MTGQKRTPNFHPGAEKGKLHRERGVPEAQKIPASKLEEAAHSKNRMVRDGAIRAETMAGWKHKGRGRAGIRTGRSRHELTVEMEVP
jgi:hypothetical protein